MHKRNILQYRNLDMHILDLYIATWKLHKMQRRNNVFFSSSLHLLYNGFINSVIVESHFRFLFDIKKRKEKTIERSGNNNTLQNRNENAYKKSPPPVDS